MRLHCFHADLKRAADLFVRFAFSQQPNNFGFARRQDRSLGGFRPRLEQVAQQHFYDVSAEEWSVSCEGLYGVDEPLLAFSLTKVASRSGPEDACDEPFGVLQS